MNGNEMIQNGLELTTNEYNFDMTGDTFTNNKMFTMRQLTGSVCGYVVSMSSSSSVLVSINGMESVLRVLICGQPCSFFSKVSL